MKSMLPNFPARRKRQERSRQIKTFIVVTQQTLLIVVDRYTRRDMHGAPIVPTGRQEIQE